MKWLMIVCAMVACLASGQDDAVRKLAKRYTMQRVPSVEMIEALKLSAGEGAHILHEPGRLSLLVVATPAAHALLADALRELDRPARNVRIEVVTRKTVAANAQGAGIQGSGGVVIRDGSPSVHGTVSAHAVSSSSGGGSVTRQLLVTMEGSTASIQVSEEVAYPEWIVAWGCRHGVIAQNWVVEDVGAFLTAEPVVNGDGSLISVRLTPELSAVVDGQPRRIALTQVATEVTVANGGTVSLGGLAQQNDFYRRYLVGADLGGRAENVEITLTPTLLDYSGAAVTVPSTP